MSIQIHYFNDVNFSKVKVFKKVYKNKETNLHHLDVHLNNQDLYFQTPQFVMKSYSGNQLEIACNNEKFIQFINNLEDHISDLLHKYSNDIFNGKKFTLEKIKKGLVRTFLKNQNEQNEQSKNFIVNTSENTKFFNQHKIEIKKDQLNSNSDIILLLRLNGVSFKGSTFKCNFVLEQAKVYCVQKLKEYSLIDEMDNQTYLEISDELDDEYYEESEAESEAESAESAESVKNKENLFFE